jgi:hypothetical protein
MVLNPNEQYLLDEYLVRQVQFHRISSIQYLLQFYHFYTLYTCRGYNKQDVNNKETSSFNKNQPSTRT